ncbi:hypothetical protein ACP4OV_025850 [Aristida adscensionis]
MIRTCCILLLVAMAVATAAEAEAPIGPLEPISNKDINNPWLQDLGRWVMNQTSSVLSFDKVVSVTMLQRPYSPELKGLLYALTIDASPRVGGTVRYKALVFVDNSTNTRWLLSEPDYS